MPERIPHRELRNRSAQVLRDVAAGGSYEITNHGEVVAVLSPPPAGSSVRIRAATRHGGFSRLPRAGRANRVQDVLDDLRGGP